MKLALPIPDRLASKANLNPVTGCWDWQDALDVYGYGRLQVAGKARKAHRLTYETHFGPVPQGFCVCHTCDNRACVNPDHLFLGTPGDNNADMMRKGRNRPGGRPMPWHTNGNAKLTKEQALGVLFDVFVVGRTRVSVARRLGLSIGAVSRLCLGQAWRGLAESVMIALAYTREN